MNADDNGRKNEGGGERGDALNKDFTPAAGTPAKAKKSEKEKRAAQKRGIIIAFTVMVAIIVIFYVAVPALNAFIKKKQAEEKAKEPTSDYMDGIVSYIFYDADYNEDIYADEEYMKKERHISYKNGNDTYLISDENYAQYGAPLVFFGEYFDAVRNGEYEDFDKFFTDHYLENPTHRAKFTPQKIYDITIESLTTSGSDKDASYTFRVGFRIFKNNGTFRNDIGRDDLGNDKMRPLVYELVDVDGELRINYIGVGMPVHDDEEAVGCRSAVGAEAVAAALVCAALPALRGKKRRED